MSNHHPTRDKLLDAASELVSKRGISSLTMQAVAKAGHVTRQTVYFYFGTRAALISAMMQRRFQLHPLAKKARELATPPATKTKFDEFIRVALRFSDEVGVAAFAEWAQASQDEELLNALRERTDANIALTTRIMADLKRQRLLRPNWSAELAAEWVNAQLYPTQHYALSVIRGWPLKRITDRTLEMLHRDLFND